MLAELANLKDWQPLIAATVVLVGAIIAYRAAMAKVNLDRELADRAILRAKLALYLRLIFALKLLRQDCERLLKLISPGLFENNVIRSSDLVLQEPQELIESWLSLDSFDFETIEVLRDIRSSLRDWNIALAPNDDKVAKQWETKQLRPMDLPWQLCDSAKRISSMCEVANQHLSDTTEAARAKLGL